QSRDEIAEGQWLDLGDVAARRPQHEARAVDEAQTAVLHGHGADVAVRAVPHGGGIGELLAGRRAVRAGRRPGRVLASGRSLHAYAQQAVLEVDVVGE